MRTKQMMLVTLGCLLLWTATAAVAGQHSMKVGKKGEITLTKATKVGDRVLQPDTYIVQHRTSGGDHFVRFQEVKKAEGGDYGGEISYTDNAGEIKCRMEPAGALIEKTTVYIAPEKGGDRIMKVAIKGEDVMHIF